MGSGCGLGGGWREEREYILVARTLGSWAKDSSYFLHWDISHYTMVIRSPVICHPVLHGQSVCFMVSPRAEVIWSLCSSPVPSHQPEQCLADVDAR